MNLDGRLGLEPFPADGALERPVFVVSHHVPGQSSGVAVSVETLVATEPLLVCKQQNDLIRLPL